MKRKPNGKPARGKPPALRALERAARTAIETAQRTGTPAFVLQANEVVDIAAATTDRARKRKRTRSH